MIATQMLQHFTENLAREAARETVPLMINAIFERLFRRAADPEGMAFYLDRMETGEASRAQIARQIKDGAQNEDLAALDNAGSADGSFGGVADGAGMDGGAITEADSVTQFHDGYLL